MLFSELLKDDILKFRDKKSKSLVLLKAYILNDGDEAKFDTSNELVYTDYQYALNALVNQVDDIEWKKQKVVFLAFEFNVKDNKDADIGSDYVNPNTGAIGISLCNLVYKKIHILTGTVTIDNIDVDPSSEFKTIRDLNIVWKDNDNKDVPEEIKEMMMNQTLTHFFANK